MKPASSRNKGRIGEYQAAAILRGKRAPLSGAVGQMGDVLPGELWQGWCVEVKRRKKFPALVESALNQAKASIGIGDLRKPLVLFREDRGRWLIAAYAEDLVAFVEALAEVGQGQQIKAHLRDIERSVAEIRARL